MYAALKLFYTRPTSHT